jgi:PBP1b-binding outer membrane lipoprotein LpoB
MIKVSGFFTLLFLCLLLNSCNNNETKQIDVSPKTDQENNELIKNQFIKANQQLNKKKTMKWIIMPKVTN